MTVFFGIDSYTAWRNYSADPKKYQDQQRDDPDTKQKIDYFLKNASKIESAEDLYKDRRMMQIVLSAFSLEDAIDKMGIIKKAFTEDPNDSESLVRRLAEKKYETMAKELALHKEGAFDKFKDEDFLNDIIDRFVQNETEVSMGEQDEQLRQAAYFARNIQKQDGIYNILGDKILRSVMTAYLDLPDQFAVQSVESQAEYIKKRIDIDEFKTTVESEFSDKDLENAKADVETLTGAQNVADAAASQIEVLTQSLQLAYDSYEALSEVTDPGGAYASEIPVQEAAVPELLQYQAIQQTATEAVTRIKGFMTTLEGYIDSAESASASQLSSLKTSFSSIVSSINSTISNATYYDPVSGTEQNALLNGSNTTLTTQITSSGDEIDYDVFDVSTIQTYLADAETAFNAISSSADSSNITEAKIKLGGAQYRNDDIDEALTANQQALDSVNTTVEVFATTLNTQELSLGKRSIDDSLNRITKIEEYLDAIKDIANESRNRTSTADRSDLQTQFEEYRDLIRQEIENTGSAGLDNFINNAATQSYEVINGSTLQVTGGYDLATQIADVLDAGGVDTDAAAEAMYTTSITSTIYTDRARDTLEPEQEMFNHALGYDALGNIQNVIYSIHDGLASYIAEAAEGGNNLLSSDQNDIDYSVSSSLTPITLNAYNSFESDFGAALDDIISGMTVDTATAQSALQDAISYLEGIDRRLGSDNRKINFEYGKSAVIVDSLTPTEEEDAENAYETNTFTTKFLERFLILNGSSNLMSAGADDYVLGLFGDGTGDTSQYMNNIFNLIA